MEMLFHGGTIIAADNTWALWAVLALTVAISIFLEQKYNGHQIYPPLLYL